jgi:hypothetical protein
MSFREKSAWITLFSVLLCFGVYFGAVAAYHLSGGGWTIGGHRLSGQGWASFHLVMACALAFVALQIGLNLAARWTTPKDGLGPKDEREKLIQARSHTLGYYVLMVLTLILGIPFHAGLPGVVLVNLALLDVVVAGLVVSVAQIIMFRRGF